MILAIMHSYIHEQAMMDITPNSSSVIIAGDKCILFLVLVVTVNLLQSRFSSRKLFTVISAAHQKVKEGEMLLGIDLSYNLRIVRSLQGR